MKTKNPTAPQALFFFLLFTSYFFLSAPSSFAAKEALYKALSPEHGLSWHDAEVINLENGKPAFLFRGGIADLVDGAQVHLSLSHDGGIASAMVVLER